MACRSIVHPKQIPLRGRMDMADIDCPDDNGSHSLFHSSTEKMTHVPIDAISDLDGLQVLNVIEASSTSHKN